MYYKLSNTAKRTDIEDTFEIPFKYPDLYVPEVVIFGLNEVTIPIITSENNTQISLAIWGMLPSGYKGDWAAFQSVANTLNLTENSLEHNAWQMEAFKGRRCLVIVNGFFTSLLKNGEVYPHYVSFASKKPFLLAGLYNHTEDGFLSCSILLGKASGMISRYQNLSDLMPKIIDKSKMSSWLSTDTDQLELKHILKNTIYTGLEVHPIAKELFNQDISYDSMLAPFRYKQIPPRE